MGRKNKDTRLSGKEAIVVKIKKATNSRISDRLTLEQSEEFLKCADSLFYFMEHYVKIQNPTRGAIFFNPRPYQREFCEIILHNRFSIIDAPRQTGKSSSVAAILLWYLIFNNDFRIGIAANKLSSAKEIMSRLRFAYEELPYWLKPAVDEYNKFSISFENGSHIEASATTEDSFRGRSLNIIFLDEFSHVKPSIAEEFWTSMLPTVSAEGEQSDTKVIITSTPNGTEGTFAVLWFGAVMGDNGFAHYKVDSSRVEGRGEDFKQQMLKKMSLSKYLQEFEGAFISNKDTLIASMTLEAIPVQKPLHVWNNINFYADKFEGRKIGIACDIGTGVGADYHTIEIFDISTLEQLAEFSNNTMTQTQFATDLIRLMAQLNKLGVGDIYYTVESNGVGIGVLNLLQNSKAPILDKATLISSQYNKLLGINMNTITKQKSAMKFKDLVESYRLKIHSEKLISELRFFVKHGNGFRAETGLHDDLVMGCLNFMAMLDELSNYEESVYDAIMGMNETGSEEDSEPMPFLI